MYQNEGIIKQHLILVDNALHSQIYFHPYPLHIILLKFIILNQPL